MTMLFYKYNISRKIYHEEVENIETQQETSTLGANMPQKKFYRARPHCNPFSHNDIFNYPINPDSIDWSSDHFSSILFYVNKRVREIKDDTNTVYFYPTLEPDFLDIGCGFGGLTVSLSVCFPHKLILGIEIRAKVSEYVRLRILSIRKEYPGQFGNCSVLRTNSMKYMPNFFRKGSIEKLFFCFPDPHFKRKNHRRRILSYSLLSEYAFFLKPGGRLYCITDVKDLHHWHLLSCGNHELFHVLEEEKILNDECISIIRNETEESKKVRREGRNMFYAVFERVLA